MASTRQTTATPSGPSPSASRFWKSWRNTESNKRPLYLLTERKLFRGLSFLLPYTARAYNSQNMSERSPKTFNFNDLWHHSVEFGAKVARAVCARVNNCLIKHHARHIRSPGMASRRVQAQPGGLHAPWCCLLKGISPRKCQYRGETHHSYLNCFRFMIKLSWGECAVRI